MILTFGTKAETLQQLSGSLSSASVPKLLYFNVKQWRDTPNKWLALIGETFDGAELAVRSSAKNEDGEQRSFAGAYTSCLKVESREKQKISEAIEQVVSSYDDSPLNQILVQTMVESVAASGVITSHVLGDGAPYVVMNYDDESGKTDSVTGGIGVNKTVMIYRDTDEKLIESPRVRRWWAMVRELESCFPDIPLDIEFAETNDGKLFLLQVRRIAVAKTWDDSIRERIEKTKAFIEKFFIERSRTRSNVLGQRTILGEMPDWNPAEMIGTSPRNLASSLYRRLITRHTWRHARRFMGYRDPVDEDLMVMIGGRPYIDVRNSFNSFLPANLPDDVGARVVDQWLDYLNAHPQYHDKVEFEVAHTVLDFNFEDSYQERYGATDLEALRVCLRGLTMSALDLSDQSTLMSSRAQVVELEARQQNREPVESKLTDSFAALMRARHLLDECQQYGTFPFSVIARHAFIADALLRSAVKRGAISDDRLDVFRRSIRTVSSDFSRDHAAVVSESQSKETFLKRYGHLRPGTYDIMSARYDQRPMLFDSSYKLIIDSDQHLFELSDPEIKNLNTLLEEAGLEVDAKHLFQYARVSISGREWAKFVFTRNLSDALEVIALWGELFGLNREQLSHQNIDTLLDLVVQPPLQDVSETLRRQADLARHDLAFTHSLQLGYIIRDVRDVYVVPLHRAAPNFITRYRIEAKPVELSVTDSKMPELQGRIVCIENADPGFDWIFTRGIAGLITKFGGANSHMAIRCAEYGLPAAIGCGEQTFDRLVNASYINLDCGNKKVETSHG